MSFLQAAGLAVRLFAVWLFIFAFQTGGAVLALSKSAAFESAQIAYMFVPTVVIALLGIFLWRFPLAVARLLVPRTSELATSISLLECWKLGSVIVGLLVFSEAGPMLLRAVAYAIYNSRHNLEVFPAELQGVFVEAVGKGVIAFVLVFKNGFVYSRFGGAL